MEVKDYVLLFTTCLFALFFVLSVLYYTKQRGRWDLERQDLLNRIYAKNTGEYVAMTKSNPESRSRTRESLYKQEKLKKAQDLVEKYNPSREV